CRYSDDLAVGFIGPKAEAEAIKQQLATFLREELKLSLSEEKTVITHARSSAAKFLGYEVTILQNDAKQSQVKRENTKRSFNQRSINAGIKLRIPRAVLQDKYTCYMKNGKPIHRSELENESDFTIISTYHSNTEGSWNITVWPTIFIPSVASNGSCNNRSQRRWRTSTKPPCGKST